MSELLASMIPSSLSYTLPLVPLFLFFWLMQHRSNRTLVAESEIEAKAEAKEVALKMLKLTGIEDVAVEKSDNYSQNDFDETEQKILLSPDTFDQKDLTAIGLAARAVGKAIFSRQAPDEAKLLGTIKHSLLISFWIVFTVLAFGLMANSPITILVGYGLIALMLLFVVIQIRLEFGVNRRVKELLDQTNALDEQEKNGVHRVLRAEAMKF